MTNYQGERLCAVEDTLGIGQICRWPSGKIAWSVAEVLPGFSPESYLDAIEKAWSLWSAVCGIEPYRVSNHNDSNVVFSTQRIGPGGVLADCQLPCGVITMHGSQVGLRVDVLEDWIRADNPPNDKVDLGRVLTHELGHALGIPHIGGGNLMSPTYSVQIRLPTALDAAEAIRRYGLPPQTPIPTPPVPPSPPADGLEEVATLLTKGGKLYVRSRGITREL